MDASSPYVKKRPEDWRSGTTSAVTLSQVIEQLIGILRRQWMVFAGIVALSLLLGVVLLLTTPPRYVAHSMLLIDSSKARSFQQQQAPIGDVPIDTAQVETQLEVLKSETVALAVIKNLKLVDDPEFSGRPGLLTWLKSLVATTPVQSNELKERAALAVFLKNRSVVRVGRTYVLDIGFNSLNAARAAQIANAIADAYIVDQLEAKYQATRRASAWMQDRIKELRQQAADADRNVLEYKEKNKIVEFSQAGISGPRLLGEQQLQELNTQLGQARATASEAQARLVRVDEMMKKDLPDSTIADSLKNEVITRLRNNYLELSGKEAIWSAKYGANHLAAVNLRTQMTEIKRSIADELSRIAQSYRSEYEIAKSRAEALERSLDTLVTNSQAVNRDRLGLKDLESTAQVYHTIYDNFLQRYMDAIQQQSFPITESRIISEAAPPRLKSSPIPAVILGVSAILGLMLSAGVALLRETMDSVFRTTKQVEAKLDLNCLAAVPQLDAAAAKSARSPALLNPNPGALVVAAENRMMRQVVDDPLSNFAEAFRSIKMAVDVSRLGNLNQVIGVTSVLPKEGKSTVSSNLAELIGHAGKRVILIDSDLRNPSLTRELAPRAKYGLLEMLNGSQPASEIIHKDPATGLSFLPAVVKGRLVHSNEVLASAEFAKLITSLRGAYDYVIVDLPPLAPVVDVRATTQIVDSYVFVVEWGRTKVSLVEDQLRSCPELYERILGVVLNKTNVKALHRYETNYGKGYYQQYHSAYGYSN